MQKEIKRVLFPYRYLQTCALAHSLFLSILLAFFLSSFNLALPSDALSADGGLFKYGGSAATSSPLPPQGKVIHSTAIPAGTGGPMGPAPVLPPGSDSTVVPSTVYTGSPSMAPGAVTVRDNNVDIVSDLDDYDSEPVASIADPIEPWNRFWFQFNDIFYLHVAKPVYKGWTYITPQFFRNGLSNLFYNILFPTRFINSILQFRFLEAGVEFSRFMMNVMGSAGLANLAKNKKTIVPVDPSGEDFGQTLGRWGFGPGFYIVWPFIGPSSLRDTFGRVGDYFTDPIFYLQPWMLSTGTEVGFRLNDVGDILPTYEDLKNISVDPYLAMREAYASMRAAQIRR